MVKKFLMINLMAFTALFAIQSTGLAQEQETTRRVPIHFSYPDDLMNWAHPGWDWGEFADTQTWMFYNPLETGEQKYPVRYELGFVYISGLPVSTDDEIKIAKDLTILVQCFKAIAQLNVCFKNSDINAKAYYSPKKRDTDLGHKEKSINVFLETYLGTGRSRLTTAGYYEEDMKNDVYEAVNPGHSCRIQYNELTSIDFIAMIGKRLAGGGRTVSNDLSYNVATSTSAMCDASSDGRDLTPEPTIEESVINISIFLIHVYNGKLFMIDFNVFTGEVDTSYYTDLYDSVMFLAEKAGAFDPGGAIENQFSKETNGWYKSGDYEYARNNAIMIEQALQGTYGSPKPIVSYDRYPLPEFVDTSTILSWYPSNSDTYYYKKQSFNKMYLTNYQYFTYEHGENKGYLTDWRLNHGGGEYDYVDYNIANPVMCKIVNMDYSGTRVKIEKGGDWINLPTNLPAKIAEIYKLPESGHYVFRTFTGKWYNKFGAYIPLQVKALNVISIGWDDEGLFGGAFRTQGGNTKNAWYYAYGQLPEGEMVRDVYEIATGKIMFRSNTGKWYLNGIAVPLDPKRLKINSIEGSWFRTEGGNVLNAWYDYYNQVPVDEFITEVYEVATNKVMYRSNTGKWYLNGIAVPLDPKRLKINSIEGTWFRTEGGNVHNAWYVCHNQVPSGENIIDVHEVATDQVMYRSNTGKWYSNGIAVPLDPKRVKINSIEGTWFRTEGGNVHNAWYVCHNQVPAGEYIIDVYEVATNQVMYCSNTGKWYCNRKFFPGNPKVLKLNKLGFANAFSTVDSVSCWIYPPASAVDVHLMVQEAGGIKYDVLVYKDAQNNWYSSTGRSIRPAKVSMGKNSLTFINEYVEFNSPYFSGCYFKTKISGNHIWRNASR